MPLRGEHCLDHCLKFLYRPGTSTNKNHLAISQTNYLYDILRQPKEIASN